MVIAYHAVFAAYGFWLPNDPRGSWSNFVRSWELLQHGQATKTDKAYSLANKSHDHHGRLEAKRSLRYPPVRLTGVQARAVARGFSQSCTTCEYVLNACSILPDHVHIVARRHHHSIETIVGQLKGAGTKQLIHENRHPLPYDFDADKPPPSPWVRSCWKAYLNTAKDIQRAIQYVEQNPIKEGLPRQDWKFVVPYV